MLQLPTRLSVRKQNALGPLRDELPIAELHDAQVLHVEPALIAQAGIRRIDEESLIFHVAIEEHDLAHAVARQLVDDVAGQTNKNPGAETGRPRGTIAVSRFRLRFIAVATAGAMRPST